MNRIPMSGAASSLLRALIGRSGVVRDRILLSDIQSVDWQSLTFNGQRHQIELRVMAPDSRLAVDRMCAGLEDAEFSIPGVIVADIGVVGEIRHNFDRSTTVTIEALTISED
ncbi:MAG: hypothetical protein HOQ41_02330 [Ensifer adhaerens]|jgi:hypothetical protein|nr:hypothetical protein [Ensifer adhaerens]HWJ58958.1 hypothetical protein [Sphingomicrobium sp.]